MSQVCYLSLSCTSAMITVDENLYFVNFISLGGCALEENVSSEVTEDREPELRNRDITDDAVVEKADDLQPGSHDIESLSSGSSIELLDISDEVQDHSAVESAACPDDQNSAELPSDGAREDQREVGGGRDAEEFTNASQFVMSSSDDHFHSAARSESSVDEEAEVENVSAVLDSDADTASDVGDMMASETAEQSVDNNGDKDDGRVTEADRLYECQQTLREEELQQSRVMPSFTDRTVELDSYDNIADETARSVVLSRIVSINSHKQS